MKSFIISLLLLLAIVLQAQETQGKRVHVELVTGAKQTAQFLGMDQDSVNLGGNIKGNFTVIRIAKNRFKSIVDESGKDLLTDTTKVDTLQTAVADSTVRNSSVKDSSLNDSSVTAVDTAIADSPVVEFYQPTFLDSVEGRHVFVALERRSIDSALAVQLEGFLIRLLKESGHPVVFAPRTNFGYCRESACIRDSLAKYNAASAYIGRITSARAQDSLTIQAFWFNFGDSTKKETHSATMNLSALSTYTDIFSENKLQNFAKQLRGEKSQVNLKKKTYIKVETNPEGATISTAEKGEICKSPCTFITKDSGKVTVYAHWNVDKQLWGGKSVLNPVPHDTTKISLKLKKVHPELRIVTTPGEAEIYAGSAPLSIHSAPIGTSPDKYPIYEPGASTVQIRKAGYRDTTVTLFVPPTELTDLEINLSPITDPTEQKAQEEWYNARWKSKFGKVLMGSSVGPILAGALFTYLANVDYDDAKHIKKELDRPIIAQGANYQAKVEENHDLVDKGDRKMILGGTLVGTGILMLGVGFFLAF